MGTLKGLASRMYRLADKLEDRVLAKRKRVARAILMELLNSTPVDTSRAVSNWRVSASGSWGAEYIEAIFPGQRGSTAAASASEAMNRAEAALKVAKLRNALVIFNSVPYIRKLNEGSSAQAPAGFVEKAILAGRLAARGP